LEFFIWLQLGVGAFLPHDVLVAAWGDFASGDVRVDISAKHPGTRGTSEEIRRELVPFLRRLHEQWRRLDYVPILWRQGECRHLFPSLPELANHNLSDARSCLIHGLHDQRAQEDCLYVFIAFDQAHEDSMKSVCRVLIPHVDATLRRIEVLPDCAPSNHGHGKLEALSAREEEIMHWVSIGKTNLEIGQILGISHNTAKNHLRRIFKKLNVANRAQAVARLKRR
jgi:transcriptional regulator EpsA